MCVYVVWLDHVFLIFVFFFKEEMISYLYTYGSILLKRKVKSPAGKGLTSWLFIVFCYFPMWYPGSGVVLDCIVS